MRSRSSGQGAPRRWRSCSRSVRRSLRPTPCVPQRRTRTHGCVTREQKEKEEQEAAANTIHSCFHQRHPPPHHHHDHKRGTAPEVDCQRERESALPSSLFAPSASHPPGRGAVPVSSQRTQNTFRTVSSTPTLLSEAKRALRSGGWCRSLAAWPCSSPPFLVACARCLLCFRSS